MAKKVIPQVVDDISGELLDQGKHETVRFALDGVEYQIDLGAKNAEKLRKAFGRYIGRVPRKILDAYAASN